MLKGEALGASQHVPVWRGHPYNRDAGSRVVGREWQLRSAVARMAEQQQAAGAKDLWMQAVPGRGRDAEPGHRGLEWAPAE